MATRVPPREDGKVPACPDCDEAGQVHERAGRPNAYVGNPTDPFVCYACKATFGEPKYRPPKEKYPLAGEGGRDPDVSKALLERVRAATAPPEAL